MNWKKIVKRMTAFWAASALLLSGCQNAETIKDGDKNADAGREMGRYVEEMIQPEEGPGRCLEFTRLENGHLAVFSMEYGPMISEDGGKSWNPWQTQWYEQNGYGKSYKCAAISAGGQMFVEYIDYLEEPEESAAEEPEGEEDGSGEEPYDYPLRYQYISPEGVGQPVKMPPYPEEEDDLGIFDCWFSPEGVLYAAWGRGNELYELELNGDEEKTAEPKLILQEEHRIEEVRFTGDELIAVNSEGAYIYDRKNGILKENDTALDDFIREKVSENKNIVYNPGGSYSVYLYGDESGMLYLACREGIFAHQLGGGTMEKIVDGALCTLGDPSRKLYGMLPLEDENFFVLYDEEAGLFTYDESIPVTPEKELYVYGLQRDSLVQQEVILFMKAHPDVYVRYETGLNGKSGQTAEDVIKNLNTEILAGKGPDVLILDGFPVETYQDKGLLADLSGLLERAEQEGEIFENIAGAFEKEGKISAIPMRFSFPVILGDKESLTGMDGLEEMAATVEKLRQKKESGSVMGGAAPRETMKLLALNSAPAWQNPDGTMNEEAVEEFLTQAKRIYAAEGSGVTEEDKENILERRVGFYEDGDAALITTQAYLLIENVALDVFMNANRIGIGELTSVWAVQTMISASQQKEGMAYGMLPGQAGNTFFPQTIAGIVATSENQELAEQFLAEMLLSETVEERVLPVNRKALERQLDFGEIPYGEMIGSMGLISDDGVNMDMEVRQLTREQEEWFYETVASLDTPWLSGGLLEEAVFDSGEKVLEGEWDIPQALEEIENKVKLSLMEQK